MELTDPQNPRLLTNLEVLKIIKDKLESKKKVRRQQTLLYTGAKYLNTKSPCSKQTESGVQGFANDVKVFDLTKSEILMLINHCPSSQVELSVVSYIVFETSIYTIDIRSHNEMCCHLFLCTRCH
ncbi:unnamed protein product [Schistosoma rodhaini]|uniref:DNA-directed RNA polymerase III subunit RPC9 n=1 Tax=Schistosoma rodhaini TaxID=6188 RepID=A0A183QI01_9TREM|nr:unnamed protein product [Schistosoma rodhaini]